MVLVVSKIGQGGGISRGHYGISALGLFCGG